MLNLFKNVLVLAPHTDDGELGVGGTLTKLIELGATITYVAFSTAEQSVPDGLPKNILQEEVKTATGILGIKPENLLIYNFEVRKLNFARQEILEKLVTLRNSNDFDLLFIPSLNDIHQDHSVVSIEGLRAFKGITVLGYELPWNNFNFQTTCFVKLEEKHIEKKIEALSSYDSQNFRDYLSSDFIRSLARTRGVQISTKYAECFEVVRLIFSL
jgi:LmbE family N-acetylglucosaminyl deacetylase